MWRSPRCAPRAPPATSPTAYSTTPSSCSASVMTRQPPKRSTRPRRSPTASAARTRASTRQPTGSSHHGRGLTAAFDGDRLPVPLHHPAAPIRVRKARSGGRIAARRAWVDGSRRRRKTCRARTRRPDWCACPRMFANNATVGAVSTVLELFLDSPLDGRKYRLSDVELRPGTRRLRRGGPHGAI